MQRPTREESAIKKKLLIKEFKKPSTANEAIDRIFKRDTKKGADFVIDRGWRFYVHLNKMISPMAVNRDLKLVSLRMGESGKLEKVWQVDND